MNLPSTVIRRSGQPDHRPPSGKHQLGRLASGEQWHGTSRIVDRPGRRRANRRSWLAVNAAARAQAVTARVSIELITTDDGGWYIVESCPDGGYDLYGAELTFLEHHDRKWQAIHSAKHPDGVAS